jgi:L-threonylcarbamoyladenylate synthase
MILAAEQPGAIARAADVLRRGGLCAFPTETVYGLGANALDAEAVARVFEVKARPAFDPLIVHVPDLESVPRVARSTDARVELLARRFWPGPLTLVLEKQADLPDLVTSGLPTVGVRVPSHPVALALLFETGLPIAAPSANPFGYVSPTTAAHVEELLGDRIELVLDGGPATVGVESTILSLVSPRPEILRPGAITREELEAVLGHEVSFETRVESAPQAPGQLALHYATRTPLALLGPGPGPNERVGLLCFSQPGHASAYAAVEVLGEDLRVAAARLFAALRRLDAQGLDRIVSESCPETGVGVAIMDRLRRAAARR